MKRLLKFVLVFSFLFYSLNINLHNTNFSFAQEEMESADVFVFIADENNTPIMDVLSFEIIDVESGRKISVSSDNAMIMASLENGKSYEIRIVENGKYTLTPIRFSIQDGMPLKKDGNILEMLILSEKSEDNIGIDTVNQAEKFSTISLNITKGGKALENIQINMFKWDGRLPNLVSRFVTDENGNVNVANLDANSKYELQIANVEYKFDKGKVEFSTDDNGNINTINGKTVENIDDVTINIVAFDKQDTKLNAKTVKFVVLDKETKNTIKDVEITVNTVDPILKSYKRGLSKENGEVVFELEGQVGGKIYTATISKNQQFLWDFTPEEITFSIDENLNIMYLTENTAFLITKNDRTHLFDDLRNLITKSEELLKENFKTENAVSKLKEKLIELINGAKLELEKESIPYYIQGFIDEITKTYAELEKYKAEKEVFVVGSSVSVLLPIFEIEKTPNNAPMVKLPIFELKKESDCKVEKMNKEKTNDKKILAKTGYGINGMILTSLISVFGVVITRKKEK